MDRLDTMRLLLSVVDTGSLSAAGRRLNMPLATVSRHISDLEAHLKTRLLLRSSRRIALTEAGQGFVQSCRRILDDVEEAERQASGEYSAPKGELVLTAALVFGRLYVVPVLAGFLAAYPDIDVRLVLSDSAVNLIESDIHIAVRMGKLADSNLKAVRVGSIRRVLCASPDYLAARGTPQTPQDLARYDCVTFVGPTQPDIWDFTVGNTRESVRVRSRLVVNSAEAAVDAALAGVGVTAVFSYHAADAVRDGRLVLLPFYNEAAAIPVSLVYAMGGLLPLKMRAFLDYAAPRLKAKLAA
jgi:DNA-binding transcriptional LysR family regulator